MLLILVEILAAVAATIYVIFTWNYGFWKRHGVPHETPVFFFGNLKEALTGKKHIGMIYTDLYRKFNNASYYGLYKLRAPALTIRDPELIKAVLVKDSSSFFENDFQSSPEKDAIMYFNPFFHVGDAWKKRRAQWSGAVTPSKLKGLYSTMNEKSDIMVEYMYNHVKEHPNEPLEAKELSAKYLTDVVTSGMLGMQMNSFVETDNIFKKIALSFFVSGSFWTGMLNMLYMVVPEMNAIYPRGFLENWIKKECMDIGKSVIELRKKHGTTKNDFFDGFMREEIVDYTEVAGRVLGFLTEGVETSSGLISFLLYELAAHPQIQTTLRKVLEEEAAESDGIISFEKIQNIKYLDMVINETMRIYPAAMFLHKVCTKKYELPPAVAGARPFTVPVGMPVNICIYALHHDPQYFPEPETFNPERFRNEDQIPKNTFLPFGEGPRVCIGSRLALTNAKVAISALVRNFELRVDPRTLPRPLPIDPSFLLTRPVGDLWLTFHKIY